jgi:hypothetical protein
MGVHASKQPGTAKPISALAILYGADQEIFGFSQDVYGLPEMPHQGTLIAPGVKFF